MKAHKSEKHSNRTKWLLNLSNKICFFSLSLIKLVIKRFLLMIVRFVLSHPNVKIKIKPAFNRFPRIKHRLKRFAVANRLLERRYIWVPKESTSYTPREGHSVRTAYIYAHILKRQSNQKRL